ncbi:hypothetical protein BDV36DRAFT_250883 [Aspergillus pseudocaelatus]|uniref:Uncharacterized protein n=1 Tax=Aspergillus pseudocaelatus TaxID=1825620 RepID=A0ABQ6WRR7_9EURO|nr:hypothetical protein BDV36DRAFT_250883 [Aspergillus pseudocaelatus]
MDKSASDGPWTFLRRTRYHPMQATALALGLSGCNPSTRSTSCDMTNALNGPVSLIAFGELPSI